MNRLISGAAAVLLMLAAACAQAQEAPQTMELYVAQGAIDEDTAQQLTALLDRALGEEARWTLTMQEDGEDLRARVLADRAPDLAICGPGEAAPWAKEGLLLPLQDRISDQERMQRQALDPCVWEETLFMAPLLARHRQMAVNVRLFEQRQMDTLLDRTAYPVWYPAQFQQIVEEFSVFGVTPAEIWPAQMEDCAAIEALVQAVYGGYFLSEDGEIVHVDGAQTLAGMKWLREMVQSGLIVRVQSRQEALEHFCSGESAIFLDWTAREERSCRKTLAANGVQIMTVPYPASCGMPVRSFELAGACAFDSGDAQRNALALRAVEFVHEDAQAQLVLGSRAIWQDDSIWLPCLDADGRGTTLRRLLCGALAGVLDRGEDPAQALGMVQAAMDALR